MKIKNDLKIVAVLRRIFNVRQWSDYDRLKAFSLYVSRGVQKMFVPKSQESKDAQKSFAKAVEDLNLTEESLCKKKRALYRLSIFMCLLAFAIFGYAVYDLIYGYVKAAIISVILSMIAWVLAFRYHFWYFQISERKLGCTFMEWYRKGLLGKKP